MPRLAKITPCENYVEGCWIRPHWQKSVRLPHAAPPSARLTPMRAQFVARNRPLAEVPIRTKPAGM